VHVTSHFDAADYSASYAHGVTCDGVDGWLLVALRRVARVWIGMNGRMRNRGCGEQLKARSLAAAASALQPPSHPAATDA